ncbi:MAG: hypothetical protein ACLTE2_09755 [Eubacteriales bacterium]
MRVVGDNKYCEVIKMHYNQYNNIPMGIGAVLARNPEARRNFALASQEEQTALIDSCTHCNSYEEMCDIVNSQATQNQLQKNRAHENTQIKTNIFKDNPTLFNN